MDVRGNANIKGAIGQIMGYPNRKRVARQIGTHRKSALVGTGVLVTPQLAWIRNSQPKQFLQELKEHAFTTGNPRIREAVKARMLRMIKAELDERHEVYPKNGNISQVLKDRYGIEISSVTIGTYVRDAKLCEKWIDRCTAEQFFRGMKSGEIKGQRQDVARAIRRKATKIAWDLLRKRKDEFPTGELIVALLREELGIDYNLTSVYELVDLKQLQIKWIGKCSGNAFLVHLKKGSYASTGEAVNKAVNARATRLVCGVLNRNRRLFPSGPNIARQLEKCFGVKIELNTLMKHVDIQTLQMEWIRRCKDKKLFLRTLKAKKFTGCPPKVRAQADQKFRAIARLEIKRHRIECPTPPNTAEWIWKRYHVRIGSRTVNRVMDIADEQIRWMETSSDWAVLNAVDKFAATRDRRVLDARDARVYMAVVNLMGDWRGISWSTLRACMKKHPELAFLRRAVSDGTVDQRIALTIRVNREGRQPKLHDLIGERLDQLWATREVVALEKAGMRSEVVVSILHEGLPGRVATIVPGARFEHYFFDDLTAGRVPTVASDSRILLLSFMHWLSESQTADVLLRLNRAMQIGGHAVFTSSIGYTYTKNITAILDIFGFGAVHAGQVRLTAVGGEGCRKLETVSNLLELRKVRDVDGTPTRARLLNRSPSSVKSGREQEQPKGRGDRSYEADTLVDAVPVVSLWKPNAIIVDRRLELKSIGVVMDDGTGHQAGLLELKGCGGTVVGFNVDPRRPCIVEVDGYQIPKSLGPALAQMMKGDLGGIEVPPSMAQDYRVFVSAVSRNATGLVQTPPRPITTRPRIRPR